MEHLFFCLMVVYHLNWNTQELIVNCEVTLSGEQSHSEMAQVAYVLKKFTAFCLTGRFVALR